ncbi:MAG: hypothetical protein Kow0027_18600 [Saprospiraceae bacterium]
MRPSILLLLLLVGQVSFAQYQLGLRTERYSGTSGLFLNPTSQLYNPLKWDLNLVGVGAFISNNYTFLRQTSTTDFLFSLSDKTDLIKAEHVEGSVAQDTYVIDFNNAKRRHYATTFGYVDGPALSVRIAENHAVGIFSRAAVLGGSQDIPAVFSYYPYNDRAFYDTFTVPKFQGAAMGWKEFGVNYAYKLPTYYGSLSFGINVRRLTTYEGAFITSDRPFRYTKLPDDVATLENAEGEFGFTTTHLHANEFKPRKSGNGWAFDLAATALIDEDGYGGYRWRLSAALLDIGWARFTSAEKHHIGTDPSANIDLHDYMKYSNQLMHLDDIARQFSYETMGDSLASLIGNSFTLALPASLSLQADYALNNLVFVNATLVQSIPTPLPSPQRGCILALTPRLEHRWFSLSAPMVLYNWSSLRMGLAARLGYLVIGSDHVGSLFGQKDFYGTDLYVALKFNPFDLNLGWFGGGGSTGSGGKKIRRGGKVKCYQF